LRNVPAVILLETMLSVTNCFKALENIFEVDKIKGRRESDENVQTEKRHQ
jgi:hypothetical protein